MKILYIITQSEEGGAQKNVADLANGLDKNIYQVAVAAGPEGNWQFFNFLSPNIKLIRLNHLRRAINPWQDWLAFFEIRRLLKKENPDVLHLHSSKAGVVGSLAARIYNLFAPRHFEQALSAGFAKAELREKTAAGGQALNEGRRPEHSRGTGLEWEAESEGLAARRLKVIYTVHGAVFTAAFGWLTRQLFLWLEKLTAPLKDKIICVSENDKKLWLKYQAAPAEKLVVIHNGLDSNQLDLLPKDEARENLLSQSAPLFAAARGLDPNFQLVGTIANLYPEKGLPFFVKAAGILNQDAKFKNVIFTIIGEGAQRKLLEEMIKEAKLENRFILAGPIASAAKYLKALDIFVLPSIKEGLPYTILEAMAAGRPIVASFVGGIPEMIENNQNGFLVLPKNAEMLAKKIRELLDNQTLADTFAANSASKIKDFSLAKMVEETEKVYSERAM